MTHYRLAPKTGSALSRSKIPHNITQAHSKTSYSENITMKIGSVSIDVILRRVRATIVAVEKQ